MTTSKLTIELLQDIAHIGRRWEIIEISAGQARNSFIPKWLAREVNAERLKKIEQDKKRAKEMARMKLEKAFEIQKMLDGQRLEFSLKWKWTKVFWGLSEHEIISRVREKYGIPFEKWDVKLPNKTHIKTPGEHLVYFHITRDTLAKMIISIKVLEA